MRDFDVPLAASKVNAWRPLHLVLSKFAALYAQNFPDPVVLEAVNDIEELTSLLENKIWQKIIVLNASLEAMERNGVPVLLPAE
jgi:hypothetical protein